MTWGKPAWYMLGVGHHAALTRSMCDCNELGEGFTCGVLDETRAVIAWTQGALVQPKICKGYGGMACDARLGLPRSGRPGIPQGMQHAVHPRWGCSDSSQWLWLAVVT